MLQDFVNLLLSIYAFYSLKRKEKKSNCKGTRLQLHPQNIALGMLLHPDFISHVWK